MGRINEEKLCKMKVFLYIYIIWAEGKGWFLFFYIWLCNSDGDTGSQTLLGLIVHRHHQRLNGEIKSSTFISLLLIRSTASWQTDSFYDWLSVDPAGENTPTWRLWGFSDIQVMVVQVSLCLCPCATGRVQNWRSETSFRKMNKSSWTRRWTLGQPHLTR